MHAVVVAMGTRWEGRRGQLSEDTAELFLFGA